MAYYAAFDNNSNVIAWYDTDWASYSVDFSNTTTFVAVDPTTWSNRLNGYWYVSNGTLDMYPVISVPKTTISTTDFYNRFTLPEKLALSQANTSNAQVNQWTLQALTANWIDLTNTIVTEGVGTLVDMGILTTDRANAILQAAS